MLGQTGHTEVVRVVFDPREGALRGAAAASSGRTTTRRRACVRATTSGTQYRSAIYTYGDEQREAAEASREAYQRALQPPDYGEITTEIRPAPEFYYAEDYHQQYLAKNPGGYCGIGGTGVACPIGLGRDPLRLSGARRR